MKKKNYKFKKRKQTKKRPKGKISLFSNMPFLAILLCLLMVFVFLVQINMPITKLDPNGLDFLNQYEYPVSNITIYGCMEPYDVGDGVVTFGPGLTYKTAGLGFDDLNKELGTNYDQDNSCIKTSHLLKLQQIRLEEYENIVVNIATNYDVKFTQHQFNALVLLAYNSPNLFKDTEFINVIINTDSTFEEYVKAADDYYRQFDTYHTKFGNGWYNRIIDSAQMYYNKDYIYQNYEEFR